MKFELSMVLRQMTWSVRRKGARQALGAMEDYD